MKRLSKLTAPALAGVVREAAKEAAIAEIENCVKEGADMIDLHLSCLDDTSEDTLREIISSSPVPVLALHYNMRCDWSGCGHTEQMREELFLRAVSAGAAGVDMQGYTFHLPSKTAFCGKDEYTFTKGNPREIVTDERVIERQKAFIERIHGMGAEVLLSCHPNIPMTSEQVVSLASFLEQRGADIIKIVTVAQSEEDLAESIKAMILLKKQIKTPVAYHANGAAGKLSRVVNPALGGQIAFCVSRRTPSSTAEQPLLKTVRCAVEAMKNL